MLLLVLLAEYANACRLVSMNPAELGLCTTLFTIIPPSEWHMNIRSLFEESASCQCHNSAWFGRE